VAKREYDKAIEDYTAAIRLEPNASYYVSRASAWNNKQDFDRAIEDYSEAVRLDPKYAWAQLGRAVAKTLKRDHKAIPEFRAVIDLDGWKGGQAPYAVILGHLAARQAGDDAEAKQFLKDSSGKLDEAWPHPVIDYLRGEIDEAKLLKLADTNDKETEARCYLAMDLALKDRTAEAREHFRWVSDRGKTTFIEYTIAIAELARFDKAGK
jgi:lipoprotein NlpI